MSHGPIYLWQLIYQAKTDVVNRGAPETVSVDRWLQPLSLPTPPKPGLHSSRQSFQPYEETARFPEIVSEDRWHQPWSEPVRSRILPVALQSTTTFTAVIAAAASVDGWGTQLSTPQRQLLGLWTAQQQFFAYDPAVFVPSIDGWLTPLSEPAKSKISVAAAAQQFLAYDPAVFVPLPNSWWAPFVEVPKVKPPVAWQQYLAFDPAVFVPSIDGWSAPLSEPPKPKASFAAAAQQFLATSIFFTAATPPIDSWGAQLSIPQRWLLGLPATQQQAVVFVPVVTTQVFEDSWHQRWTDPIQLSTNWKTGDSPAGFVAVSNPVPPVSAWATAWSTPSRKIPVADQQALAFVPVVAAAAVTEGSWHQRWVDPIQISAKWTTGDSSYGFASIQANVPTIDGWGSQFIEVPKPKAGTTAACQQFFAFDPQPFTPVGPWQPLSDPIQISAKWTTGDNSYGFAATQTVVPPFGYFSPLSEPQRQLAGLAARFQQIDAKGFVPIVPPFVFFFGNEEPLPWPGYRSNQFIRENYDSFVLPPFPIPNPPQTQAKFTVSGPSVSDLFPVSGVVYPYAPETRKTVP